MNTYFRNTALVLTIIGGLNWGLVGLFGFDLVAYLFGPMTILSRLTYIWVGLAAVTLAFMPSCSLREVVRHKMQ